MGIMRLPKTPDELGRDILHRPIIEIDRLASGQEIPMWQTCAGTRDTTNMPPGGTGTVPNSRMILRLAHRRLVQWRGNSIKKELGTDEEKQAEEPAPHHRSLEALQET